MINILKTILNRQKTLLLVTTFSIAMGFMESAVVVYLREIYYPNGFQFPMVSLKHAIMATEIIREAATIIMLVTIGWLAGKTQSSRFAYFLLAFAIWDLVYYIFLKVIIGWPQSIFDWDILFLIPLPWVSPVLAPCLVAVTMLILALLILQTENAGMQIRLNTKMMFTFVTGSLVIIFSFMRCYLNYVKATSPQVIVAGFVPQSFDWLVFFVGLAFIISGIIMLYKNSILKSKLTTL